MSLPPKIPKGKSKGNGKTIAVIALLILLLFGGVGIMFYPMIAAKYAEAHHSEIQTLYDEIIKEVDTSEIDALWKSAQEYNEKLAAGEFSPLEYKENGYYDQLTLPNSKIMCFIRIPKINVYLPVYHGVEDSALDQGAGHMEQTSLPIGGNNTHAVISAHTGMAQSPMFTDLELLEKGDIFQIIVLGRTLTYEVDNIQVVLPQVVDLTRIQTGRDMASLITCTPYGINSHRLIVQGHRIETPTEEEVQEIIAQASTEQDTGSVWTQQYWHSVKIGGLIALMLMLALFGYAAISKAMRKKSGAEHAEKTENSQE